MEGVLWGARSGKDPQGPTPSCSVRLTLLVARGTLLVSGTPPNQHKLPCICLKAYTPWLETNSFIVFYSHTLWLGSVRRIILRCREGCLVPWSWGVLQEEVQEQVKSRRGNSQCFIEKTERETPQSRAVLEGSGTVTELLELDEPFN